MRRERRSSLTRRSGAHACRGSCRTWRGCWRMASRRRSRTHRPRRPWASSACGRCTSSTSRAGPRLTAGMRCCSCVATIPNGSRSAASPSRCSTSTGAAPRSVSARWPRSSRRARRFTGSMPPSCASPTTGATRPRWSRRSAISASAKRSRSARSPPKAACSNTARTRTSSRTSSRVTGPERCGAALRRLFHGRGCGVTVFAPGNRRASAAAIRS